MDNFSEFLSRFENVRKNGKDYTAKCPAHADAKNSLSLSEKSDKVILHCFAGCSVNSICSALGIEIKDLFLSPKLKGNNLQKRISAIYEYKDETGTLLYQNIRYEPKDFRQRKPDGNGGFTYKLNGIRRVPYRLPELIKEQTQNPDKTVFLCEGEKDADNLRSLGLTASSFKNWKAEYNLFIKEAHVVLLVDHDQSGIRQAEKSAAIIAPVAKTLKVIDLFEHEPLPEKHGLDVSDWLETGKTKNELQQIIENAPDFESKKAMKIGYTFGELQNLDLKPPEEIIRGLGRGYNGLLNAVTNVGKSTLIRNLALCLITGKQFPPLTVSGKLRRVCIIDTEDTLSYLKKDIGKMIVGFSAEEKELIKSNLLLICDLPVADEEIRLNQRDHFSLIAGAINEFNADAVFVDTISSSFTIRNENDNGEIKENVMKPLRRLARLTDSAVLASHHIGKSKLEDGAIKENAHKGRGASALSDQSKVVLNLETGTTADIILSCGKLKGERFADAILLYDSANRWLSRQGEINAVSNYEIVLKLFADSKSYKRKEIDEMLDGEMAKATITRNLKSAVERGELDRIKGIYSKNAQMLTPIRNEHLSINGKGQQNQSVTENIKVSAFDEKEDVSINRNEYFPNCRNCDLEMNLDKDGESYFCSMGCGSYKLPEGKIYKSEDRNLNYG